MSAISRNRLLNAMVFFAQKTGACDRTKVCRLLFLLDFQHFRKTGLSVTEEVYTAWRLGPVPVSLFEEWDSPQPDFKRMFNLVADRRRDSKRLFLQPKIDFDESNFTPRQLRMMSDIAAEYRDTAGDDIDIMSAFNGAWMRVWANGQGHNRRIPYEFALTPGDPESAASFERSQNELYRLAAHQALLATR